MTWWNVRLTVVELIEAESAEQAIEILRGRLDRADFNVYDDPGGPHDADAFESEGQVAMKFNDHTNDLGDWCPWSLTSAPADADNETPCPAGCSSSRATEEN